MMIFKDIYIVTCRFIRSGDRLTQYLLLCALLIYSFAKVYHLHSDQFVISDPYARRNSNEFLELFWKKICSPAKGGFTQVPNSNGCEYIHADKGIAVEKYGIEWAWVTSVSFKFLSFERGVLDLNYTLTFRKRDHKNYYRTGHVSFSLKRYHSRHELILMKVQPQLSFEESLIDDSFGDVGNEFAYDGKTFVEGIFSSHQLLGIQEIRKIHVEGRHYDIIEMKSSNDAFIKLKNFYELGKLPKRHFKDFLTYSLSQTTYVITSKLRSDSESMNCISSIQKLLSVIVGMFIAALIPMYWTERTKDPQITIAPDYVHPPIYDNPPPLPDLPRPEDFDTFHG